MNRELNAHSPLSKRASLHTLGCRLNSAETAQLAQGFSQRGYNIVPFGKNLGPIEPFLRY
jgi:threonylcarbamoyladenosine tRNA methylthiotransferase MtaB